VQLTVDTMVAPTLQLNEAAAHDPVFLPLEIL
jgi:hypothetical protein